MKSAKVQVVVTGTPWVGQGIMGIDTATLQLIRQAREEILWTIYAVSLNAEEYLAALEDRLSAGVRVYLIVNQFWEQDEAVRRRLLWLLSRNQRCELYSYDPPRDESSDLHAKVLVVDKKTALVGSSNLSRRAMNGNLELGVMIEGAAAAEVARTVARLFAVPHLVRRIPTPS